MNNTQDFITTTTTSQETKSKFVQKLSAIKDKLFKFVDKHFIAMIVFTLIICNAIGFTFCACISNQIIENIVAGVATVANIAAVIIGLMLMASDR